jgi:hypothetical protein
MKIIDYFWHLTLPLIAMSLSAFATALRQDHSVGDNARPEAELQARRHDRLLAGGGAGGKQVLVEQVLELHTAMFEAGGVGVRQVVGDIVDGQLLSHHAAGGVEECSYHGVLRSCVFDPCSAVWPLR